MEEIRLNLQFFGDDADPEPEPEPTLGDDADPEPEPEPTLYKILENVDVTINGVKTELRRNVKIKKTVNGQIVGVECDGDEIDLDESWINMLIANGQIAPLVEEEEEADENAGT